MHVCAALMILGYFSKPNSDWENAIARTFTLVGYPNAPHSAQSSAPNPAVVLRIDHPKRTLSVAHPPPPRAGVPSSDDRAPAPSETPARRKISIDDFRRANGTSVQSQRGLQQATTRVDESFAFPSAGAMDVRSVDGAMGFESMLLSDLRNAFAGSGVSGVGMIATVKFRLGADGQLLEPKILHSSGTAEFNAAVLAAFGRVRVRAFPRHALGRDYEVVFRAVTH